MSTETVCICHNDNLPIVEDAISALQRSQADAIRALGPDSTIEANDLLPQYPKQVLSSFFFEIAPDRYDREVDDRERYRNIHDCRLITGTGLNVPVYVPTIHTQETLLSEDVRDQVRKFAQKYPLNWAIRVDLVEKQGAYYSDILNLMSYVQHLFGAPIPDDISSLHELEDVLNQLSHCFIVMQTPLVNFTNKPANFQFRTDAVKDILHHKPGSRRMMSGTFQMFLTDEIFCTGLTENDRAEKNSLKNIGLFNMNMQVEWLCLGKHLLDAFRSHVDEKLKGLTDEIAVAE